MLSSVYFSFCSVFALPLAFAQGSMNGADECPALQASTMPGTYNIVLDSDPSFVYHPDNCTSTNQRFIQRTWEQDCGPAIEAICGTSSSSNTTIARAGTWTWAFHNEGGSTCQVGLYQEVTDRTKLGGSLERECCINHFRAVAASFPFNPADPLIHPTFNRLSVNIAAGDFPRTQSSFPNGLSAESSGGQAGIGYPSYILQG